MKKSYVIRKFLSVSALLICAVLLAMTVAGCNSSKADPNAPTNPVVISRLEADARYYADIDIKDYGTITVLINHEVAPETARNFVELATSNFYHGVTFHRIIEGFMMQGGDPDGDGYGGSDKTIVGEFAANGFENNLSHRRGVISMARAEDYNSASSQFFIVHQDSSASLDGKYAAFGEVTQGMEVVDKICTDAQPINNNGYIAADKQPVINSIIIRVDR